MKKIGLFFLTTLLVLTAYAQNQNTIIDNSFPYYVNAETLGRTAIGGDTIFVSSTRTDPLRFQLLNGNSEKPVVVINFGGDVKISSPNSYTWGAITFENCRYIKISGAGHPEHKYGFELSADQSGLGFVDLSSDCEAEFIKISHDGFFGITAKKDFDGNPPVPYPVFENLIIHDCFIENVSEGMYLGETKSPGMEFKHVRIYNNIVRNTLRESIQIANMVEDVEIYNNTLLNAGLENLIYHTNILQIGDNSVVNAYNNILIGAPSTGIITLGKGECTFTNNYLSDNLGVFIDNRTISENLSPVKFQNNYFRAITGNQVIRNYNENNYITVEDNIYDTDIPFFYNQDVNATNYTVSNNILGAISELQFTDPSSNDYSLASSNPLEYKNIGAPSGPDHFDAVCEHIVVTSEMITDLVEGGSVISPLFLFDEQNLNIENDEHAISASWKPDMAMNEDSYHMVIDLGSHYNISEIDLHVTQENNGITIEYGDDCNWSTLLVDPCDISNVWSKNTTDVTTRFLRVSTYDTYLTTVNEIMIYGCPIIKESRQIVIAPSMVTDKVEGGSVNSPLLLFDEQNIDYLLGSHATSNSWKPDYLMHKTAYHVVVDLGYEYHISKIDLHDMNDEHDLTVEYGDSISWSTLFVYPCEHFNEWSENSTDISTRYLRFSMYESPNAAVNEVLIYGYPVTSCFNNSNDNLSIEPVSINDKNSNLEHIKLHPNPVEEKLNIKFPIKMVGKNKLVIRNVLGVSLYSREYLISTENQLLELNETELPRTRGIYTLSVCHESGYLETLSFIIN
jgi:hypothetical protein